ncbi:hypothetical protein HNP40_002454 [Mycobacteroides chelonae]|nr:hypothetical protein [Mycobacteroides chelonae]
MADCLAGTYLRWVAQGSSPRFTLSTGDGLDTVIAALIAFRDDPIEAGDAIDSHGSAFERVSAVQRGFLDGAAPCTRIDMAEITKRHGGLPVNPPVGEPGDIPVSADTLRALMTVLQAVYAPAGPPRLTELAQPTHEKGLTTGDFTAYSMVISRYALSVENQHDLPLDTGQSALRAACLTGVASAAMAQTSVPTREPHPFVLDAEDLDEAVSGLLANGVVASDVNGTTIPAGFSRIDAFRDGVAGSTDRCLRRYG